MRIPVLSGVIKRRLLVNFRADPKVIQNLLPSPFRPKLHGRHAVLGVCLIRLENLRPSGVPRIAGFSSENAAHRVAVQWNDSNGVLKEGVFIPRRDTDALVNRLVGGRFFPGEHHAARFSITERAGFIDLAMKSLDGKVFLNVSGEEVDSLPSSSCFKTLEEASAFFEAGSLGYSPSRDNQRMDGLLLRTLEWRIRAFAVQSVFCSFFDDPKRFPPGSIEFDHALIMREVRHEWHRAEDLLSIPGPALKSLSHQPTEGASIAG